MDVKEAVQKVWELMVNNNPTMPVVAREYCRMFNISEHDLLHRVLDYDRQMAAVRLDRLSDFLASVIINATK